MADTIQIHGDKLDDDPVCISMKRNPQRSFMGHRLTWCILLLASGMQAGSESVAQDARRQRPVVAEQVRSFSKRDRHESLESGISYLLKQQSEDGAFRSTYYGNLKQGAAITSLILFCLSHAPEKTILRNRDSIEHASRFLKLGIRKHGYVANVSGPDYAVYSTSLTLLADRKMRQRRPTEESDWPTILNGQERETLQRFLCEAQLGRIHKLTPGDPDFGGWDLSGWMQGPRVSPGTNVSVTSFALWALDGSTLEQANDVRQRASKWLDRVRNPDGGFHFHPKKDHEGNKAGWSDDDRKQPQSYGTATCDGIRARLAIDQPLGQVASSLHWITESQFDEMVPGFNAADRRSKESGWSRGLFYYYAMSISLLEMQIDEAKEARKSLRIDSKLESDWKKFKAKVDNIQQFVISQQSTDGSWSNPSARMREDDPLIATAFSVIALSTP